MSASSESVVSTKSLTKRFGELTAVDGLSLDIPRGEIFGLVGPDGAGKTTTLRMLSGLMDPTEGEAWVFGHNSATEPEAVKDRIGYMAQRFGVYSDLSVMENMNFYADLFNVAPSDRGALMTRLLRMTRMDAFTKRRAGQLSGGMKQKLALMCTLLHHPQVLFLDEPTTGVDPVSRRDFWAIIYQLIKDGMTVLVTTAYLDEAERCNRVGLMHKGRLIRCAPPETLRTQMEEQCYELICRNGRAAREVLLKQAGVVSVEPAGAALHVFVKPGEASIESLSRLLDKEGLGPANFRPIVPSLEDVFIALIRKAE